MNTHRFPRALTLPLAIGCGLLAACTSTPVKTLRTPAIPEPPSCEWLAAEIQKAEDLQREALARQHGAWKAVLPFAVVARHASAGAAASGAENRLRALRDEHAQRACA